MGRGRPKKRPPTPSDSLTLPVGAEAEVRSNDPGFVGSFYEVTITGHVASSGRYTVVYSTLLTDDERPVEETAPAADVRPRPPPSATSGFAVHETVEAFHKEGWWAGVVSAVPRPRVYKVAFPTSRETMEFEEMALRPHCVFQAGRWVPAAEVVLDDGSALFLEGTQVEVSRSAKSFGESWSPASVLKLIGATNFLVQYMHSGSDREVATEILAAQYIRPAPTFRKYRFARSSHVEVMLDDSWWSGVIQDVLGRGINKKYVVKLKSYETDMEDVECLDVLAVQNTHIRPKLHWNGKKWVHRQKSANAPALATRKRPVSYAFSSHKEVGETSDEHGSYRQKKLKNADVVSERIPPLWSVRNESYEIKSSWSSSCPEGKKKQGIAVVAPPSLAPTAGFSQLISVSSLAQSSHLEQGPSRKIIIPSAPVAAPQSLELLASLFGSFEQPRPLPQVPLFGMRSINLQTPKEVVCAKSIEEARSTIPMLEGLAKTKNGDDNVTIISTKHALSQQGCGSGTDSEPLAIQQLSLGKTSPVWARNEAMEIFSKMPQRPNLNHFRQHCPELRDGIAFGLMLSFADLAESIDRLDVHQDDIGGVFEDKKRCLHFLAENGFDVRDLQSRLEALLRIAPHDDNDNIVSLMVASGTCTGCY